MAVFNVSVMNGRGTRTVFECDYSSKRAALAAFHQLAAKWIRDTDACVSLGLLNHVGADYRSFTTLAVKYTDATRVELTPAFYGEG